MSRNNLSNFDGNADFANTVVLITGSTDGLGFHLANEYLKRGALLIVHGTTTNKVKNTLMRFETDSSKKIKGIAANLETHKDRLRLADEAFNAFGRLDIIILNAGTVGPLGSFKGLALSDYKRCFDVNFWGIVEVLHQIIGHQNFNKNSGCRFVISGSASSRKLENHHAIPYITSKSVLESLTKLLARELAEYDSTINTLLLPKLATRLHPQSNDAVEPRDLAPFFFMLTKKNGSINGKCVNLAIWPRRQLEPLFTQSKIFVLNSKTPTVSYDFEKTLSARRKYAGRPKIRIILAEDVLPERAFEARLIESLSNLLVICLDNWYLKTTKIRKDLNISYPDGGKDTGKIICSFAIDNCNYLLIQVSNTSLLQTIESESGTALFNEGLEIPKGPYFLHAENPLGPSNSLDLQSFYRSAPTKVYDYKDSDKLRDKLAEIHGVDRDSIVLSGMGSAELIERILSTMVDSGEAVMSCHPTFDAVTGICQKLGFRHVRLLIPLIEQELRWSYDCATIIKKADNLTRVLYIASPNNPTGSALSLLQFQELVSSLPQLCTIVIDQAYAEWLWNSEEYISPRDLIKIGDDVTRVIVLRSFSKAFGLPNIRVGYAVCDSFVATCLRESGTQFPISEVVCQIASAALSDSKHIENSIRYIRTEKAYLSELIKNTGVQAIETPINVLSFLCDFPCQKLVQFLRFGGHYARTTEHSRIFTYNLGRKDQNRHFVRLIQLFTHGLKQSKKSVGIQKIIEI